jgi:hypothetical protein
LDAAAVPLVAPLVVLVTRPGAVEVDVLVAVWVTDADSDVVDTVEVMVLATDWDVAVVVGVCDVVSWVDVD